MYLVKHSGDVWEKEPLPQRPVEAYRNINPFIDLTDVEASPFNCAGDALAGHARVGLS